jgi:hypothetical protein
VVDNASILWIAKQCLKIANGLFYIHKPHEVTTRKRYPLVHLHSFAYNYKSKREQEDAVDLKNVQGHHGDMKPQTILMLLDESITPAADTNDCIR